MCLGSLAEFRFCNSPCQLYYVCYMDAEEDNQDFRSFDSTVNPLESVMLLLCSKGSFHCRGLSFAKNLMFADDCFTHTPLPPLATVGRVRGHP